MYFNPPSRLTILIIEIYKIKGLKCDNRNKMYLIILYIFIYVGRIFITLDKKSMRPSSSG